MKKRTMYVSVTANSVDERTQHASTQYGAAGREKQRSEGEKEGEREKARERGE